jgi:hypothetical protein
VKSWTDTLISKTKTVMMNFAKPKWIVQGDVFMWGRVEFHSELRNKRSTGKVYGGGWWYTDNENKILYLYSSSVDFGVPTQEQIENGLKDYRRFEDYKILWNPEIYQFEVGELPNLEWKTINRIKTC